MNVQNGLTIMLFGLGMDNHWLLRFEPSLASCNDDNDLEISASQIKGSVKNNRYGSAKGN
jgi:hypothetical protein